MLLWIDGFDHYMQKDSVAGNTGQTIKQYLQAANYTVSTDATSSPYLSVVAGRIDGQLALQLQIPANASSLPLLSWGYTPAAGATKIVFGFAIKATDARVRICRIAGGVLDLNWDAETGKMSVTVAGQTTLGASVLILNAWYFIEVVLDKANSTMQIYANDELQLDVDMTTAPTAPVTISWGQTSTNTAKSTQVIDDFYVLDNAAGTHIDRLGPCSVNTRFPTSDITTQWSIVANGANPAPTDHYKVAAQLDPLGTNKPYLQSNINGNVDEFRSSAVLPNSNTIYGVGLVALARKGDLDDRSLGLKLTVGDTSDEQQIALTTSNKYIQSTYETPPGGGDWNQNAVESATFGIVTR